MAKVNKRTYPLFRGCHLRREAGYLGSIKMKTLTCTLLSLLGTAMLAWAGANPDLFTVQDFGAKGDGKTDDTAAFQKALDAAGQEGGGVVYAPRGNYFFAGHLNVPNAVTLKGVWESVPSHIGIRNPGGAKPTDD